MANPGELTKLLEQGFLTGEHLHSSPDGEYRFSLKTITPLDEVQAQKDAEEHFELAATKDTSAKNIFSAIEVLARSIKSVNGVDLESIPGAAGQNDLEKRRSIVKKFSEKLLLDLWSSYQEVRAPTLLQGTEEENDAVKKS